MTTVVKQFTCDHCSTIGKITIKDSDAGFEDIVFCPVCGGDIFEPADTEDDEAS